MQAGLKRPQWCCVASPPLWMGGLAVSAVRLGSHGGHCCITAVMMIYKSGGGGGPRVVARCWSTHCGVIQMPDRGAAEGVEELAHVGCMCCSCFHLRADGERQLTRRQRPDLADRKDGAPARRGGRVRRFVGRDDLRLLPADQVKTPRRRPAPGVWPTLPGPPPEAVEGVPRVPTACPA